MNLFDDIVNKRARKKALEGFVASLDALGYRYELVEGNLSDGELMEFYMKALGKGEREGFFPVLAVNEPVLFEAMDIAKSDGFDIASALASKLPQSEAVFAARLSETELLPEDMVEGDETILDSLLDGFMAINAFSLPFTEYSKSFRMTALIALPTIKPWEAAILLPFGDWNDCPAPVDMAAMLKKWYESFGAVPAVFSGNALEVFLPTPIEDRSAHEAASEIVAFGGIPHASQAEKSNAYLELGKYIAGKSVWHFWWD